MRQGYRIWNFRCSIYCLAQRRRVQDMSPDGTGSRTEQNQSRNRRYFYSPSAARNPQRGIGFFHMRFPCRLRGEVTRMAI